MRETCSLAVWVLPWTCRRWANITSKGTLLAKLLASATDQNAHESDPTKLPPGLIKVNFFRAYVSRIEISLAVCSYTPFRVCHLWGCWYHLISFMHIGLTSYLSNRTDRLELCFPNNMSDSSHSCAQTSSFWTSFISYKRKLLICAVSTYCRHMWEVLLLFQRM